MLPRRPPKHRPPTRPETMTTKVVSYKSYQREVDSVSVKELETRDKDGIKHTWSGYIDEHYQANFTWEFDWEELKKQGFDRLVGHLIVNSDNGHWNPHRVDIDWTEPNQSISTSLGRVQEKDRLSVRRFLDPMLDPQFSELHYDVTFEYELTAHHTEKPPLEKVFLELPKPKKSSYDEKFVASDKTDVVLVVEGKKLNVNKTFLAFHSDYFSTLFSAKFKEGQMKEIEIKEVSYEDFELLCSSFYPNPQFPNDSTSEKLLEMASRFQVSSVIGIVEYHLLNNSKIAYEKMLWLADEYIMPKLLEKCISQMNSLEMAKKLEKSPEFEKLSDRTSSLIFRQLLKSL